MKLFTLKNLLLCAAFGLSATAASAGENNCVIGCGPNGNSSMLGLNVLSQTSNAGNVSSIFDGGYGTNEVNKWGTTRNITEVTLAGVCQEAECGSTTLNIDLMAGEGGNAITTAGSDESGSTLVGQNGGQFVSGAALGIQFGGNNTDISTRGAAAFSNLGSVKAIGTDVSSSLTSYGSGQTDSTLGTNGTACPTCVDILGGTTVTSNSGMSVQAMAKGGHSGQAIGISNSSLTESAASIGSMFKTGATQD